MPNRCGNKPARSAERDPVAVMRIITCLIRCAGPEPGKQLHAFAHMLRSVDMEQIAGDRLDDLALQHEGRRLRLESAHRGCHPARLFRQMRK